MAVSMSASFALLVSAVGCAPLLPPDCVTALWTAVPLPAAATGTYREHARHSGNPQILYRRTVSAWWRARPIPASWPKRTMMID
jgi:hypothetical protein